MWLVSFSDEAAHYIEHNQPYILELMLAIGRLMFTDDGMPVDGRVETLGDARYLWMIAGHVVVLYLNADRTLIELILLQDDDVLSKLFGR